MNKTLSISLLCAVFCISHAMEEVPVHRNQHVSSGTVSPQEDTPLEFMSLFAKHKESIRSAMEQSIHGCRAKMRAPENWQQHSSYEQMVRTLENTLSKIEDPATLAAAEEIFNEPAYHEAFVNFARQSQQEISFEESRKTLIPAFVTTYKLLAQYSDRLSSPEVLIHVGLLRKCVPDALYSEEELIKELYSEMHNQTVTEILHRIFHE